MSGPLGPSGPPRAPDGIVVPGPVVIDTPEGIAFFQMAARKSALSLELKGLRRSAHRRSAYSICKSEYGLRGNRQSVLRQMQALVDAAIAARSAN